MLIGKPLPFVKNYIEFIDEAIKTYCPEKGLTRIKKQWLSICIMAILVTNSVCWARFQKAGIGRYSVAALSWMFRKSGIPWNMLLPMSVCAILRRHGITEGSLGINDNVSPSTRNFEFMKYCADQMPQGKCIKAFRADSASYQSAIINHCHAKGILYAIGADLDEAVVRQIKSIGDSDWHSYKNGRIAETVHCMNKTHQAFRLVVIRRPVQGELFERTGEAERYTVIATNRSESPEEVVQWYNQRGQCSENRIKELKIGFGMERMPCGQFEANAVFFRIGCLAYNVGRLFVLKTLNSSWHRCQVQTLRWKLYSLAGKIVFRGRYVWLKVRRHQRSLFQEIRTGSWKFAST